MMKNVTKLKFFIVPLLETYKQKFAVVECVIAEIIKMWLMRVLAFAQTDIYHEQSQHDSTD